MSQIDDDAGEPGADDALGFEDEKTSPEVRVKLIRDDGRPTIIVATEARGRNRIVEMLRGDGWNAVEAHDPEELVEMTLALAPQVLLVDAEMRRTDDVSLPAAIRQHRPDAALRTIAIIAGGDQLSAQIARALADGFDDFIADVDNDVKTLARATANLRAARTLAQVNRQRRDAAPGKRPAS